MNTAIVNEPRRVVPRWRNFLSTVEMGEFSSLKNATQIYQIPTADINAAKRAWNTNRSLFSAGELLATAIQANDISAAKEAAEFIFRHKDECSPFVLRTAQQVLTYRNQLIIEDSPTEASLWRQPKFDRKIIGLLRRQLSDFPNDSIRWMDLALAYTISGLHEKARRAIYTALSLGGGNRFIIRSAVRFFVHIDEPDLALRILAKSPSTKHDPWLIAAHIAVADIAKKQSGFQKIAQAMTLSGGHSPFNLSELSSALATSELSFGSDKKSKALFRKSVEDPTENSVAQLRWAEDQLGKQVIDHQLTVPRNFEAEARIALSTARWDDTVKSSREWLCDEPFSSRPAIWGSYVASVVIGNYNEALKIAIEGLKANPYDPTLLNNAAFCEASLNKIKEAEDYLSKIPTAITSNENVAVRATEGLILFRKGLRQEGRKKYLEAIAIAQENDLVRQEALALSFLAREEILAGDGFEEAAFKRAEDLVKNQNFIDLTKLLEYEKLLLGNRRNS